MNRVRVRILIAAALMLSLSACLGTVVGAAIDVSLEVAKVPFKVAGAAIDVVTDDDEEVDKDED
jgi:hypothetical protein